jgi:flagellar hook-basal body complex protein FliE
MSPISAIPSALGNYDFAALARPTSSVTGPAALPDMGGGLDLTQGVTGAQAPTDSFSSMLGKMVEDVNAKQVAAADSASALQSGEAVPLHQTVVAMEEANVSFQLMVEVRNKLLEAYQEMMRMQV